jgi:GDP-4-dehydro-6-deoxy-D-mannose reductase
MKRILVTGVNGFVGPHLVKELTDHDIHVVGIGGPKGASTTLPSEEYITVDLNDAEAVKHLDFTSVDAVIHLAGLAAVGPSFDRPLEYIRTNMGLEVNLFEAAIGQDAKPKFLIISSGSLYDPKASLPLDETSSVIPSSPYAISKLGQEQLAQYYGIRGFECIIARPFNHIGPGQGLGFIVPDLMKQIVAVKKGTIQEVSVGNLDAQRDYTDVRDIVRAYRLLLEKGRAGEIYNICSGKAVSGHDMLAKIVETVGVDPKITQDPAKMRPSDAPIIYGNRQKITADTGWEPTIDLTTTLQDVSRQY